MRLEPCDWLIGNIPSLVMMGLNLYCQALSIGITTPRFRRLFQ